MVVELFLIACYSNE